MAGGAGRRWWRGRWPLIVLAAVGLVVVVLTAGLLVRALRPSPPPITDYTPTPAIPPDIVASATPTAAPAPGLPTVPPCPSETVVGVWAHQDDDLIFAEPDLDAAIAAGDCVRSLYVTAGDAGRGTAYYQSRELGILRAYNVMRGVLTQWDRQDVTLLSGPHLTVFTPEDDPDITVAFLRLPDGGLDGSGFPSNADESLTKLMQGAIPSLTPLDGGPAVSETQLVDSVEEAIRSWGADEVLTLIPQQSPLSRGDHPDHSAVGSIVRTAWQAAGIPEAHVRYYIGYPSKDLPANVSGDTLRRKLDIYRAYANQDPVVACVTDDACLATRGFGDWLQRSYAKSDGELDLP